MKTKAVVTAMMMVAVIAGNAHAGAGNGYDRLMGVVGGAERLGPLLAKKCTQYFNGMERYAAVAGPEVDRAIQGRFPGNFSCVSGGGQIIDGPVTALYSDFELVRWEKRGFPDFSASQGGGMTWSVRIGGELSSYIVLSVAPGSENVVDAHIASLSEQNTSTGRSGDRGVTLTRNEIISAIEGLAKANDMDLIDASAQIVTQPEAREALESYIRAHHK